MASESLHATGCHSASADRVDDTTLLLKQALDESRLYFSHFQSQTKDSVERVQADSNAVHRDDKEVFQRYLQVLRSQLAPIRKLPPELLSEIFVLSLPSTVTYISYVGVLDLMEQKSLWSLNLVSICKGWHDVATNTPQLWTYPLNIKFFMSSSLPSPWHDNANDIDSCLQILSRPTPLSLLLTGEISDSMPDWRNCLQSLIQESSRWQSLHLAIDFDYENHIDDHDFPSRSHRLFCDVLSSIEYLPLLEYLHFRIQIAWSSSIETILHEYFLPTVEGAKVFRNAPNLRYLILDDSLLPINEHSTSDSNSDRYSDETDLARRQYSQQVLWPNLEALEIKHVQVESTVEYLQLHHDVFCHLRILILTDLDIRGLWLIPSELEGRKPIGAFNQLTTLVIHEPTDLMMYEVLYYLRDIITLPALKSLDVMVRAIDDAEPVNLAWTLSSFISNRCAQTLETLHLTGVCGDIEVLNFLPHVKVFRR
ncbi:hypothetical protein K435DRAFT_374446 [Dendrothele bispora CBS 962.96]|uniref:Uncharacterized protein n=1 Tax=Dendrothele bispora (strain CBS 962.96) TaxID=1314807 RepID=A0A4S8LCB5_DENBC|nr:hypothetical protein K435DRAFT_374446 [Dendrothele bispora CBS 962.96]